LTIEASTTGSFAGLQHAGNRDRHAAHGVHLRYQPADAFGRTVSGFLPTARTSSVSTIIGFEEALGAAAFIGELRRRLFPGAVDFAEHMIVGHEIVGEDHLVEFILPGDLASPIRRLTILAMQIQVNPIGPDHRAI